MSENKNYRLTDTSMIHEGTEVFQIEAVRDLTEHGVKAGDRGGYIESEDNLSINQGSELWVTEDSVVKGEAVVSGQSVITDGSVISGDSRIEDGYVHASIIRDSTVRGEDSPEGPTVIRNSTLTNNSRVSNNSEVNDSTLDNSTVRDNSIVEESTLGSTVVENRSEIHYSNDIKNSTLDSSSLNSMGRVRDGEFINTHTQETVVDKAKLVESNVQNSTLKNESEVVRSDIRLTDIESSVVEDVHARSYNVIYDSTVKNTTLDNRSEIHLSDDIKDSSLDSSSLNSMGRVRDGEFVNTHSQETNVDSAKLIESNVQNSTLTDDTVILRSDIRTSEIGSSAITDSLLRQSTIHGEDLDTVEKRNYQTEVVSDISLSDADIQDLGRDSLQI